MYVRVGIRGWKLIVLTSHAIVVETLAEFIADNIGYSFGIFGKLSMKKRFIIELNLVILSLERKLRKLSY